MDDISVPQIPGPKETDPEDVSWALSTAEAMWSRGEHADGVKWVRKAAEAASEAEDDVRALELAKAAADLAALIARRSRSDDSAPAPRVNDVATAPPTALESAPPPPPSVPPVSPTSITKIVVTPSMPRAFPSKPVGAKPLSPRPLSSGGKPQSPLPAGGAMALAENATAKQPNAAKAPRSPSSDLEVAKAGVADTAPQPVFDAEAATATEALTAFDSAGATVVAKVHDILEAQQPGGAKSAADWDRAPTATTLPEEMEKDPDTLGEGRLTQVGGAPPPSITSAPQTAPHARPLASTAPHDPEIQTSQAVRVVCWRDGTGVRIAPAGTVVSAITVDAVLVALEPDTDLTAWLSRRSR